MSFSLLLQQHSSVSSSMDSSHSVPYTPICNNVSTYPFAVGGPTAVAGPNLSTVTPLPVPFIKPQVPPKPKILPSQSISNLPKLSNNKPPPPIRRTVTVGNCIGGGSSRSLDPNQAVTRIIDCYRNYHVSPVRSDLIRAEKP